MFVHWKLGIWSVFALSTVWGEVSGEITGFARTWLVSKALEIGTILKLLGKENSGLPRLDGGSVVTGGGCVGGVVPNFWARGWMIPGSDSNVAPTGEKILGGADVVGGFVVGGTCTLLPHGGWPGIRDGIKP